MKKSVVFKKPAFSDSRFDFIRIFQFIIVVCILTLKDVMECLDAGWVASNRSSQCSVSAFLSF